MSYTSDKRLYLNEDRTKVVEEGPEARYLLVNEGGELSDEEAKQYGLTAKHAKTEVVEADDAKAKQVATPPENKAQAMEKNKDK